LVALVTENFNQGAWPNQEAGYAIGKSKHVVPVIVNSARLKGLVEELQGVPFDTGDTSGSVTRLVNRLHDQFPFMFS
jgi:hypothetical protein